MECCIVKPNRLGYNVAMVSIEELNHKQLEELLQLADAISPRCNWDVYDFQCSLEESPARESWHKVMKEAGKLEVELGL